MKIRKNGDVITLTENDLKKIVKKVLVMEAPMREEQIILSDMPKEATLGRRHDYYVENTKDVVRGFITPSASRDNKDKSLKIYEFNLKSPIQGCKALILEDSQSKMDKGFNVKASIKPHASGSGVAYNIHYALSDACKKGIYNLSMRDKNNPNVTVGTVSIESNGGDWNTEIDFIGKMKSTGEESDI